MDFFEVLEYVLPRTGSSPVALCLGGILLCLPLLLVALAKPAVTKETPAKGRGFSKGKIK